VYISVYCDWHLQLVCYYTSKVVGSLCHELAVRIPIPGSLYKLCISTRFPYNIWQL